MHPVDQIMLWMRLTVFAMIIFAVWHAIPIIKMAWVVWALGG